MAKQNTTDTNAMTTSFFSSIHGAQVGLINGFSVFLIVTLSSHRGSSVYAWRGREEGICDERNWENICWTEQTYSWTAMVLRTGDKTYHEWCRLTISQCYFHFSLTLLCSMQLCTYWTEVTWVHKLIATSLWYQGPCLLWLVFSDIFVGIRDILDRQIQMMVMVVSWRATGVGTTLEEDLPPSGMAA